MSGGRGTPLAAELTAGQAAESTMLEPVVERAVATPVGTRRHRRGRPRTVVGDKGYSARRTRDWLRARRVRPVIPHKANERARRDGRTRFDAAAYRGRAAVEQCVGWLTECRRVGTRYEKLAVNFLGMVHLAMIKRYLKLLFSDRA